MARFYSNDLGLYLRTRRKRLDLGGGVRLSDKALATTW